MKYEEGCLGQQEDQQYHHRNVVLFLLDFVLGLLVVVEFDLDLVLVLYQVELHVLDLLSFDDLTELLQKVHLGRLGLHLTHQAADRGYLLLKVFFLEFEKCLEGVLVGGLPDSHEDEQEGID